jgi:hypothetical protein
MAKQTPPTTPAATLPAQIEIFRAGQHTDDAGVVHNFSAADVAGMVAAYKPALREAPLTIGHPADNLPAYGWVNSLAVNTAGNLAMNTHQVQPQFAEMVAAKMFKKRSASFYPPGHANNPAPSAWYLRHVAFLGAQPPAIAGLADFAAGSAEGAINFSSGDEPAAAQAVASATPPLQPPVNQPPALTEEQNRMSQELKDQLAAAQAKIADTEAALTATKAAADTATAQLAQFAEQTKKDRTAGFVSFAEGVKAEVLLPKDRPMVVAALEALADSKPVSFAEGTTTKTVAPAEWFKAFVASRAPVVSFGEHAPGGSGFGAGAGAGQGTAGMNDDQIDQKAHAYARANKVSYSEALSAVTSFTTAA